MKTTAQLALTALLLAAPFPLHGVAATAREIGSPAPQGPKLAGYRIAERSDGPAIVDDSGSLVGAFFPFSREAIRGDDAVQRPART